MNIQALAVELSTDPLGRGYNSMTSDEAAASLNTANRSIVVDTVSGSVVLSATNQAEFTNLTAEQQDRWLNLCGINDLDVGTGPAKSIALSLFPNGTTTFDSLAALKTRLISRANELGLGWVKAGHVIEARGL